MNYKKPIIILIGLAIAILISIQTPPSGLGLASMIYMGVFVCALIFLLTNVMPDYIASMFWMAAFVIFKVATYATVFSPFAASTIWTLIGALSLGAAASKCGLLKRITYWIIKICPENYRGQVMALQLAGWVIAPTIPSVTAKVAIMAPLARALSETLGFKPHSKGAAGLFSAMLNGAYVVGVGFLTGSIVSIFLVGLIPAPYKADMTWMKWFIAALPWMIVLMVLSYFAITILFKPDEQNLPSGFAGKALKEMGPMSRAEKIVGALIAASLLLWMTEQFHHIDASMVALVAGALTYAFGIIDRKAMRENIPWDTVIFIGGILSISALMTSLNVAKWLGTIIGPLITPLLSNILVFIIVASIIVYVVRIFVISQTAAMSIFIILLIPLAISSGIHPWVIGFIITNGVLTWITPFQNTTFLAAWGAAGGDDFVTHKDILPAAIAFMGIGILGLLACVPLWKIMGMLP